MFTVCEQPLLPPACSVAWSPLGLRLWVRALCARGAFLPLRPLFRFLRFSAPLSGAEVFFWLGGHPGHGCFAGRDTPPAHQRFGRGDENYLVGEPVWMAPRTASLTHSALYLPTCLPACLPVPACLTVHGSKQAGPGEAVTHTHAVPFTFSPQWHAGVEER